MKSHLFFVLFLTVSLQVIASAQTTETGLATTPPTQQPASYYYVAKPGELTMQVNIWGDVQRPGRYEISTATDLIQLMSYAGGPTREADMSEVRITRIVRGDMGPRKAELYVDLENPYKTEESSLVLYPNDAIYVNYVTRFNYRDALALITAAALVAVAISQTMYYSHNTR